MIKIYVKQAWQMMKQQKLFSTIYIIGTALAICFTTVMAVAYYVKLAPLYPEYNRSRTYYNDNLSVKTPDNKGVVNAGFGYNLLSDRLYQLKNAEAVSGVIRQDNNSHWVHPTMGIDIKISTIFTDPAFFKIYKYEFMEGSYFSVADFESGIRTVVISDKLAQKVFHQTKGVVGKLITIDKNDYRVCGVVKLGSKLGSMSYADVILPYKTYPSYHDTFYHEPLGYFEIRFLVKDEVQGIALQEEIEALIANLNHQHKDEWTISTRPLRSHFSMAFNHMYHENNYKVTAWMLLKLYMPIVFILLLIPAINLSGMISSRMEERLAEMGVRKSFGANKSTLLSQVMWENLLLTMAGGLVGLILAWGIITLAKGWVFSLFEEAPESLYDKSITVTGEMFFTPTVFISAFLVCCIINLLSALIPAWSSLCKPIVSSLNEKE